MANTFENSDMMTLKVIAETLNQSNDLHEMLQSVLEKLLDVTGLVTGWMFLVGEKPEYTFVADYNLPPALTGGNKQPMCEGVCHCLTDYWRGKLDQPVNIIECKRLEDAKKHNWGDRCGLAHHATIPLTAGGERFGILNVAAPNKQQFTEKELMLLQSVAYQIGTAVKRIRLAKKQQELTLIEERNRLARDLHDSVNQKLSSLSLTARGTKSTIEKESRLKEPLDHIQNLSQDALKEMRSLIWQLRPAGVEEEVVTGLKKYGKHLGLDVEDQVDGVYELPRTVEEAFWRIGQEALNNVKKHAESEKAELHLTVSNTDVTLLIKDHGRGFDYNPQNKLGSLGLTSMKERAELFGGSFSIDSEPERGTKVWASFPRPDNEGRDGYGH